MGEATSGGGFRRPHGACTGAEVCGWKARGAKGGKYELSLTLHGFDNHESCGVKKIFETELQDKRTKHPLSGDRGHTAVLSRAAAGALTAQTALTRSPGLTARDV